MAFDKARSDALLAQAVENQKNFVTDDELKEQATTLVTQAVETAVAPLAEALDKVQQLLATGNIEEAKQVIEEVNSNPDTVVTDSGNVNDSNVDNGNYEA